MVDEWYYWHDSEVLGPFSARLLAGLATDGTLLRTDTVWKGGIEGGVPASQVKHLFPLVPISAIPLTEVLAPVLGIAPAVAGVGVTTAVTGTPDGTPAVSVADPKAMPASWFSGAPATVSTRRATAGKGVVIIGQDGTNVRYRMKCTKCGHEDSSWKTMAIARGTARTTFYCPKCRKKCPGEIHGHVS